MLQAAPLPQINASESVQAHTLRLSGTWGLKWKAFTPLESFSDQSAQFKHVDLPAYYYDHISDRTDGIVQGYGTYAIRITNLSSVFSQPSLFLQFSTGAWQVWWIEDDSEPVFLGENGRISTSKQTAVEGHKIGSVALPSYSDSGTLVVYFSSYLLQRSSLGDKIVIAEHDAIMFDILIGLTIKVLLLGIGLFVVIQNLVFFSHRPEPVFLLLAVFSASLILRAGLASNYVDFFLFDVGIRHITIRLEYLSMLWCGLAVFHYSVKLFPIPNAKALVLIGYAVLFMVSLITFYIDVSTMTTYLKSYQVLLVAYVGLCFAVLFNALWKQVAGAKGLLISSIPLLIALIHDIITTQFADYNVFVTEYALFIFLFFLTQNQVARFVKSLDVARHLTENLQYEIDLKTKELNDRNQELEKHTLSLRLQNQRVKLLSETDHLTGLFNRQTLEMRSQEIFDQALSYNLPLSIAMMDLDHFKRINDSYGHDVGDECLIHVGSFLRAFQFRKRDLVARYGGEEIIIILTDIPLLEAQGIIERVRKGIEQSIVSGVHEDVHLTASFGIADIATSNATSIEQLIRAADEALYAAKHNGRNRVELYQAVTDSPN